MPNPEEYTEYTIRVPESQRPLIDVFIDKNPTLTLVKTLSSNPQQVLADYLMNDYMPRINQLKYTNIADENYEELLDALLHESYSRREISRVRTDLTPLELIARRQTFCDLFLSCTNVDLPRRPNARDVRTSDFGWDIVRPIDVEAIIHLHGLADGEPKDRARAAESMQVRKQTLGFWVNRGYRALGQVHISEFDPFLYSVPNPKAMRFYRSPNPSPYAP